MTQVKILPATYLATENGVIGAEESNHCVANLGTNTFRMLQASHSQFEGGKMLPPFYDAFGVLTINFIVQYSSNLVKHGTSSSDLYVVVSVIASTFHKQVSVLWDNHQTPVTEFAVTDRLGNVYLTYPTDYLQQTCAGVGNGSWSTYDPSRVCTAK